MGNAVSHILRVDLQSRPGSLSRYEPLRRPGMTENITHRVLSACTARHDVACLPPRVVAGPSQFNRDTNSVLRMRGDDKFPDVVVPRVLRAMPRLMGKCFVPTSVRLPHGNGTHSGRLRLVSTFHLDRANSPSPECLSMIRGRGGISVCLPLFSRTSFTEL